MPGTWVHGRGLLRGEREGVAEGGRSEESGAREVVGQYDGVELARLGGPLECHARVHLLGVDKEVDELVGRHGAHERVVIDRRRAHHVAQERASGRRDRLDLRGADEAADGRRAGGSRDHRLVVPTPARRCGVNGGPRSLHDLRASAAPPL
eukprot:6175729-Pleurochrysis_carterae.AAC.1